MQRVKNLWKMPVDLGRYAREFYRSVGPQLVKARILRPVDFHSFVALCNAFDLYKVALDELQRNSISNLDPKTFDFYRTAFAHYIQLAIDFGLLPIKWE